MAGSVKNIVIGGGTGNIGKYLVSSLIKGGHNVSVISRQAWALNKASKVAPTEGARHQMAKNFISWKDIDKDGLPLDTDVVINLSGQSIGKPGPWIDSIKKSITSSRIDTTTKLAKAIAKSEAPPKLFISASAVGVYGLDAEKTYTESDPPVAKGKETFFTDLCLKWEESSKLTEECQTRVVNPRFGVVLAHNTDPMRMLLPQGLLFGGTVVGSGNQPFPWIHIEDTVSALEMVIGNEEVSGPVNFVAPQIVDNSQFTRALADACMTSVQKITLPAPLVRLMYGTERADCILLDSPKAVPQKLLDLGFEFQHKDIDSAMKAMVDALEACTTPGMRVFKMVIGRNKKAAK